MRVALTTMAVILMCSVVVAADKWPTEGDPAASGISTDPTYGITEKNPVRVGQQGSGPKAEQKYLASLRGPKGEQVTFSRTGSCCSFKTPNALIGGHALLDKFEVTWTGLEKPIFLYLDMYDYEKPLAPIGFTKAQ